LKFLYLDISFRIIFLVYNPCMNREVVLYRFLTLLTTTLGFNLGTASRSYLICSKPIQQLFYDVYSLQMKTFVLWYYHEAYLSSSYYVMNKAPRYRLEKIIKKQWYKMVKSNESVDIVSMILDWIILPLGPVKLIGEWLRSMEHYCAKVKERYDNFWYQYSAELCSSSLFPSLWHNSVPLIGVIHQ